MSDFGDPGGPSGSRPPRQSSAKFLSRLKQKRLVGDDSDDYEDDGTGMEDDMEYNPELGKKRYYIHVTSWDGNIEVCYLQFECPCFRKSPAEVVDMMGEDSDQEMEDVEDLIGDESSEEEITV